MTQFNIAHIDTLSVFATMPEYAEMKQILENMTIAIENKFNELEAKQDSLSDELDSLNKTLFPEKAVDLQNAILEIKKKIEDMNLKSRADFEEKAQELTMPIHKKIRDVVEIVAKEKHIIYVIEKANLIYVSPDAIDITPDVMSILGLPANYINTKNDTTYIN